ncbi:MAG: hypothetical protein ACXAD7_16920, partial [Candidatus Kariarchaeaceae archaeon]
MSKQEKDRDVEEHIDLLDETINDSERLDFHFTQPSVPIGQSFEFVKNAQHSEQHNETEFVYSPNNPSVSHPLSTDGRREKLQEAIDLLDELPGFEPMDPDQMEEKLFTGEIKTEIMKNEATSIELIHKEFSSRDNLIINTDHMSIKGEDEGLEMPTTEDAKQELFDKYRNIDTLAAKLGVTSRKVNIDFKPQILKEVISLRIQNHKIIEISKRINSDRHTVGDWLREDDVQQFLKEVNDNPYQVERQVDEFIQVRYPERYAEEPLDLDSIAQQYKEYAVKIPSLEQEKHELVDRYSNFPLLKQASPKNEVELLFEFEPQYLQRSIELLAAGKTISEVSTTLRIAEHVLSSWMHDYRVDEFLRDIGEVTPKTLNPFIASIYPERFHGEKILEDFLAVNTPTELETKRNALHDPTQVIEIPMSRQAKQLIFATHANTDALVEVTGLEKIQVVNGFRLQFLQRAVELRQLEFSNQEIGSELRLSTNTIKKWLEVRNFDLQAIIQSAPELIVQRIYPERFFQEQLFDQLLNEKSMPRIGTSQLYESSDLPSVISKTKQIFEDSPRLDDLMEKTGLSRDSTSAIFRPHVVRRVVELKLVGMSDSITAKLLGYKHHISVRTIIEKYDLENEFNNFQSTIFSYEKLDAFITSTFPATEYDKLVYDILGKRDNERPERVDAERTSHFFSLRSVRSTVERLGESLHVDELVKTLGREDHSARQNVIYRYEPHLLKKAVGLRIDGLTYEQISDEVGLHAHTLALWMKKNHVSDFMNQRDFTEDSWDSYLSEQYPVRYTPERIVREYLNGKTIHELDRLYKNRAYISPLLKEYLNFIPSSGKLHEYVQEGYTVPISSYLKEVIEGELLGDSYLNPRNDKFPENGI